jgi:hypothetical protein
MLSLLPAMRILGFAAAEAACVETQPLSAIQGCGGCLDVQSALHPTYASNQSAVGVLRCGGIGVSIDASAGGFPARGWLAVGVYATMTLGFMVK